MSKKILNLRTLSAEAAFLAENCANSEKGDEGAAPVVAISEASREDEEVAVVLEVLVVPPSGKG